MKEAKPHLNPVNILINLINSRQVDPEGQQKLGNIILYLLKPFIYLRLRGRTHAT